jgi:PAS domain S-box-containing protein
MGKQQTDLRVGISATQNIIHNSSCGMILAFAEGIGDDVNPALTLILGFSPEKLLGQSLMRIFHEEKREEMETQIRLLQECQLTSDICEKTIQCQTTHESRTVCCQIIVLVLSGGRKDISDLVVIGKDVFGDHEREIESQRAKERNENLLSAIIPRSIVARMKAGTDPMFVVPVALIMFIDIVRFSEFSRKFTPEQIMGTLASHFGSFDARIAHWGMVMKIKLIDDVYMCVAGLFDEGERSAAEEIVMCALECLNPWMIKI